MIVFFRECQTARLLIFNLFKPVIVAGDCFRVKKHKVLLTLILIQVRSKSLVLIKYHLFVDMLTALQRADSTLLLLRNVLLVAVLKVI